MKQFLASAFALLTLTTVATATESQRGTERSAEVAYRQRITEAIAIKDRFYTEYSMNPFFSPLQVFENGNGQQVYNLLMIDLLDPGILRSALAEIRQLQAIVQELIELTDLASRQATGMSRLSWESEHRKASALVAPLTENEERVTKRLESSGSPIRPNTVEARRR